MTQTHTQTLLIGLSGPSSSGKTTLARILRTIFNIPASPQTRNNSVSLFILHEDDFYKTDTEIPLITTTSSAHGTRTLQDWDCVQSLDLALLESTLSHVKQHGTLPPDTVSKEDKNAVGESGVSDAEVQTLKQDVENWLASLPAQGQTARNTIICLIDGFLLFPAPTSSPEGSQLRQLRDLLRPLLDLKMFLLSSRDQTISRRARRTGYVTLEGFWEDPPGYVEDVVWPNYVRDHAWMFESGRVDGEDGGVGNVREQSVEEEGIVVAPGKGELWMKGLVEWAVEVVKGGVEELRS